MCATLMEVVPVLARPICSSIILSPGTGIRVGAVIFCGMLLPSTGQQVAGLYVKISCLATHRPERHGLLQRLNGINERLHPFVNLLVRDRERRAETDGA